MANLSIRKSPQAPTAPAATSASWDPFRAMRDMLRWDPFREMAPYFSEEPAYAFMPAFEVKETREGYVFKADIPGVQEKDLDITLTGNRLTVQGKREAEHQENSDTYYAYERTYGTFTRSFTLPEGADTAHVHADLKQGVLTLVVPKAPALQPRKVSLKSDGGRS